MLNKQSNKFLKLAMINQRYKKFKPAYFSQIFIIIKKIILEMKHRIPQSTVNKNQILHWINNTIQCNQTKIQSLGNGIVYCLLLNHFYPNCIPKNKIIMVPRNNMDNKMNLKKLQQALNLLNIKSINFDIFRVSQMSYLDNWQLITKFYRHYEELQKNNSKQPQKIDQLTQNHMNFNGINKINVINQTQQSYNLPKQIPKTMQLNKTMQINPGLLTPMKGLKYFDQNAKLRFQSLKLMEQIKMIVKSQTQSDKIKVKNLKKMLGLSQQQNKEEQLEFKQLFSDCKKKQQVITID